MNRKKDTEKQEPETPKGINLKTDPIDKLKVVLAEMYMKRDEIQTQFEQLNAQIQTVRQSIRTRESN